MFRGSFARPFSPPIAAGDAAAAVSWWLSGGIAAANAIGVYQPKGATDIAASYVNLANPGTYNAAVVSGDTPTWDAVNGWKRINSVGTLTSGISPTSSSWTMIIRFSDQALGGRSYSYIGKAETGKSFALAPVENTSRRAYYNNGKLEVAGGALTSGIMAIAGQTGYYNGVSDGTIPSAWTVAGSQPLWLTSCSNISAVYTPYTIYVQAAAIYDTILSSAQVLAVTNAIALL